MQNGLSIGFVGFGEAAFHIANGLRQPGIGGITAYDINTHTPGLGEKIRHRAEETGTRLVESNAELAGSCEIILSTVTSDQAVRASEQNAPYLGAGHFYADLNSVSPALKQSIGCTIAATGAHFVEIAVMLPVPPHGHRVPMLAGGEAAPEFVERLAPLGMRIEIVGREIGVAAATKMFRSIVVKGLEALLTECVLGASRYNAEPRVFASLAEGIPGINWPELADYMVGRVVVHGERRAREMEEVAETLRSLDIEPIMAEATARRMDWSAQLGLKARFGGEAPRNYREVADAVANADQTSVTEAVLAQMASTPDPRLKKIMAALVRHVHQFAREVDLTPDEWLAGIRFLTAVGQKCTPYRQEFILLSDTLGLSSLVNELHDRRAKEAGTKSSLLGPFYRQDSPAFELGESIAAKTAGPEIALYGRVLNRAGQGIANASVEIWQPDDDGSYDMQKDDPSQMDLRGRFRTDSEGRYYLRTIAPRGYMIPMDGPVGNMIRAQARHGFRPAHIHFLVGAPGYREVVTALYLAGDDHIESDTVFGVTQSLVVKIDANDPASPFPDLPSINFDFQLAPARDAASGRVGADPSCLSPDPAGSQ